MALQIPIWDADVLDRAPLASPKSYDEGSFGTEALLRTTTHTKPLETTGNRSGISSRKPLQIPPIKLRIVTD